MNVSVIIATYGDSEWFELGWERAVPSAKGCHEFVCEHQPLMTIAQVRNYAAEKASGDWLCFLDADDELAPGYLDAMRRAVSSLPLTCPVLLTPAVQLIRKGRPGKPTFLDRGVPLTEDNWLVVGTLIQRDLFMEVGGFSDYPHGFEDWALWAKAWKAGAQIVKVPDAVYRYHVNPRSKHKQGWRDRKWQVETHQRVRAELFPERV